LWSTRLLTTEQTPLTTTATKPLADSKANHPSPVLRLVDGAVRPDTAAAVDTSELICQHGATTSVTSLPKRSLGLAMADITMLILADHNWFREQFAKLDDLQAQAPTDRAALGRVWRPLANKLDVHAYIEEKIFYPQLLKRGADDPEGETLDAIGDHNDIRDAVRQANAATVDSPEWWAAVGRAREANDDHMGEEEREGLSDFRRNAPIGLREALGRQYSEFMAQHPTSEGLPAADRDPQAYVEGIEAGSQPKPKDYSLGIGSLKGK